MFNIKITGVLFVASHFTILYSTKYIYHILENCLLVYTMADRKRKIELEQSDIEKSPKRRKAYSIDMKLKIISEAKTSNISEVSRRY